MEHCISTWWHWICSHHPKRKSNTNSLQCRKIRLFILLIKCYLFLDLGLSINGFAGCVVTSWHNIHWCGRSQADTVQTLDEMIWWDAHGSSLCPLPPSLRFHCYIVSDLPWPLPTKLGVELSQNPLKDLVASPLVLPSEAWRVRRPPASGVHQQSCNAFDFSVSKAI